MVCKFADDLTGTDLTYIYVLNTYVSQYVAICNVSGVGTFSYRVGTIS